MPFAPVNQIAEFADESATPRATARPTAGGLYWPGLLLALATTCIVAGILWDISWHISIGRDTFWTPAHLAIQLGGIMGGCVGGWLAFRHTFLGGPEERAASVGILGARAPLGAWVAMWGAVAMITSAPFDNWWHNAYGLDVKIISPPHTLLGVGMLGISLGALLLGLAHQNRVNDAMGNALFIYIGGMFLTLGSVFVMEFTTPNLQHAAIFYLVCALAFPVRLVALSVAGRISWPATKAAAVYFILQGLITWILPLFPAHPKLAPIFHPVTHMVPPAFPLLLIFPAFAIDLVLRKTGADWSGWRRLGLALAIGAAFVGVFLVSQWFFSEFLLTPWADNWFFAGNRYWGYASTPGRMSNQFWLLDRHGANFNPFDSSAAALCWALASSEAWIGLVWGGWMRKVRR